MTRIARAVALNACIALCISGCVILAPDQQVREVPPIDGSVVASVPLDAFATGEFTASNGTMLVYRLLTPENVVAGKRYPLVVQFHGSGGIGRDNRSQVEIAVRAWALPDERRRHPAFVLVPQFPVRSATYDDPVNPRSARASSALAAALELVREIAMSRPVDDRRIYATGFSMGGSATWLAPILQPNLFAAAIPVSGIAPERSQAAALKALPLLVLHGDADTENPIDADRDMVRTIHAQGGRHIRLRTYTGLAHQPPGDLIPGDWWRDWLFAQRRREPE